MQKSSLSPKQLKVLDSIDHDDIDYVLASGPVRSGKTASTVIAFLCWLSKNFTNHSFLLASRTMGQIRETLIPAIQNFGDFMEINHKVQLAHKRLEFGQNSLLLYEGQDSASAFKIRGLTLAGAYLDEVTLLRREFVGEIDNRCSVVGAKIWMTCNPEGPQHFIKKIYIDDAEAKRVDYYQFEIRDNPSLGERYIERLYNGPKDFWYRRNILGEWVAASGPVYSKYTVAEPPKEHADRYELAVDYGPVGVTTALLIGLYDNKAYIEDEWRHDGRTSQQIPASDMAREIHLKFAHYAPRRIVIDRFAQALSQELAKVFSCFIDEHTNDPHTKDKGVQATIEWLNNEHLQISEKCSFVLQEIGNYIWDEKALEVGREVPKKENDHAMDAMRYWVYNTTTNRPRSIEYKRGG